MSQREPEETLLGRAELISTLQKLGVSVDSGFKIPSTLRAETPVSIPRVRFERSLAIGAYSYVGHSSEMRSVEIGRFCSIARRVIVAQAEHPTNFVSTHPISFNPQSGFAGDGYFDSVALRRGTERGAGVNIGHDVWIGDGAVIRAGVSVGSGAIVGAGAVVVRDVPPYTIVGGVPARVIRLRFSENIVERLLASNWWNYDISSLKETLDSPDRFLGAFELVKDALPPLCPRIIDVTPASPGQYRLEIGA